MDIHKKLIDQIIFKRKAALVDLITGERSLRLDKSRLDMDGFINELEHILYTIDFLEKHDFIKCVKHTHSNAGNLFNQFSFNDLDHSDENKGISQLHALHFLREKFTKEGVCNWNIEMKPGLYSFIKNGYVTDERKKERNNFRLAVWIAILSPFLTAVFSALMTRSPITYCF